MTVSATSPSTAGAGAASGAQIQPREDLVTVTIDGFPVQVPKGTLIIRAAELLGIAIPRFCDHPLLDPVGACRQCLVEVKDAGNGRGMPKPAASCTTTVADGMVVETQLSSPVADKAQKGVMELLLINHPLDCPVCDKGGECPLQNQALSNGRAESRFEGVKRTYPKPINISAQVLLDRERCVLCARCTRFSTQVAGDPFIEMLERGALQQVGIYDKQPFESYFSGNTIQICPVGALTGAQYRFRARPFDLVSSPMTCEHCASGCSLRTDHRRGRVLRRLAGDDPQVNEEWNCDKGRWAFQYATAQDRLSAPLVRDEDGRLVPTSWPDALAVAARGLAAALRGDGPLPRGERFTVPGEVTGDGVQPADPPAPPTGVGTLVGGRVTLEDAYAYAKFARLVLGSNDVDFRARPHSAEETDFLASVVAGRAGGPGSGSSTDVSYADLEAAPVVLLAGLEPEEESPILFLRLRKAVRKASLRVVALAPFASRGLDKLSGTLLTAAPGDEPELLSALAGGPGRALRSLVGGGSDEAVGEAAGLLREPGAVVLVGERLATIPGALSAAASLAAETGARLAWVPRRAGERGALEAGAFPTLLPGGRPVGDPAARVDVGAVWGVPGLPAGLGRDGDAMLAAAAAGELGGLIVGGVDPDDLADPRLALEALDTVPFLVSLEQRASAVTERADVVLPVAAPVEKAGTFLDWEGRERPFDAVLTSGSALPDGRVLHMLADELDVPLRLPDVAATRRELAELGAWEGVRVPAPETAPVRPPTPGPGQATLATWHHLLDLGRLQDGEPFLAATAKAALARVSASTAQEIGLEGGLEGGDGSGVRSDGAASARSITISSPRGSVTLPVAITDMPDRVVWLPTNSVGSQVRRSLGVLPGGLVTVTAAQPRPASAPAGAAGGVA